MVGTPHNVGEALAVGRPDLRLADARGLGRAALARSASDRGPRRALDGRPLRVGVTFDLPVRPGAHMYLGERRPAVLRTCIDW